MKTRDLARRKRGGKQFQRRIRRDFLRKLVALLRRPFRWFVNLLDSVQILQKLAAPAAKIFRPRPFHARIFALLAAVKMAAGNLEAVFGVQYDEFFPCHDRTVPERAPRRNLSHRSRFG